MAKKKRNARRSKLYRKFWGIKQNPTQLLFRTKAAARAYAKAHGAKKFSVRKLKKGR